MYTKQQIEDLREGLDSIDEDPRDAHVGICSNMRRHLLFSAGWTYDTAVEAAVLLMEEWPLRSECPAYVVPASRYNRCAEAAKHAYDTLPKWEGVQLELRRDLLAYMRSRLEEMEGAL